VSAILELLVLTIVSLLVAFAVALIVVVVCVYMSDDYV
jgi:hypothetical protein